MAEHKNFTIYHNNDNYSTAKLGNVDFDVKNDYISPDDRANQYIDSATVTIAWDKRNTKNLSIRITPVTDEVLLEAVRQEEVYIRIQVLFHQPSECIGKTQWDHNTSGYNHPLWISEDDSFRSLQPGGSDVAYVRRFGNRVNMGRQTTWFHLTDDELSTGAVTTIPYAKSWLTCPPNYKAIPDDEDRTTAIRVEMFCAALHRRGKDIYYYERQGHRAISNRVTRPYN